MKKLPFTALLDHLVGTHQDRIGDLDAEGFRGLQVEHIGVGPAQTIDPRRYAMHISAVSGLGASFLWPESLL